MPAWTYWWLLEDRQEKTLPWIRLGISSPSALVQETSLILLFFKENKPVYLVNLIPTKNSNYSTRHADKLALFHPKHNFFKISFFPSTVIQWNKLDPNLRSAASLSAFKKNLLKFIRPSPNSVFNCQKLQRNQIPHKTTPWSKSLAWA